MSREWRNLRIRKSRAAWGWAVSLDVSSQSAAARRARKYCPMVWNQSRHRGPKARGRSSAVERTQSEPNDQRHPYHYWCDARRWDTLVWESRGDGLHRSHYRRYPEGGLSHARFSPGGYGKPP